MLEYDDTDALAVPGVEKVVEIKPLIIRNFRYGAVRGDVAVIANSTWAALQGKDALKITWDHGANPQRNSQQIRQAALDRIEQPAEMEIRNQGDWETAFEGASEKLEATYELPILAHGCLEPMSFTVEVRRRRL